MYRYSVDNAVTYTSEDLTLFRVSPFAAWMERLTLENPEHGIPPDAGSKPPENTMQRQDDVAEMLRAEGRRVALIDWDRDEPWRRRATLDAMREGVDFIVNGQLALGPLSGSCNLLMRTSGYSELGNFLYLPCDTQGRTSEQSAFRLCFLADLLHSLQGQLPPRMLIIRGGSDLLPLQTEDHMYYYRAVKQRFMEAMRSFRKHRMPDPAESSRFGRWSDCANEVLKQRALREELSTEEVAPAPEPAPVLRQAVTLVASDSSVYDRDDDRGAAEPYIPVAAASREEPAGTLAEQALQLVPGAYAAESARHRPGSAPNLAHLPERTEENAEEQGDDGEADTTGTFPGERRRADRRGRRRQDLETAAPDPVLGNLQFIGTAPARAADSRGPEIGTMEPAKPRPPPARQPKPHPLDSAGFSPTADPLIDLDREPPPSPAPGEEAGTQRIRAVEDVDKRPPGRPEQTPAFSDSLITSDICTD